MAAVAVAATLPNASEQEPGRAVGVVILVASVAEVALSVFVHGVLAVAGAIPVVGRALTEPVARPRGSLAGVA